MLEQNQTLPAPLLPGTLLRAGAVVFRISSDDGGGGLLLEDVASGEVRSCPRDKLEIGLQQNLIAVVTNEAVDCAAALPVRLRSDDQKLIESIPVYLRSPASVKIMLEKLKWIRRLERHGVRMFSPSDDLKMAVAEVEHSAGEKCPYGLHTLYDAARALKRQGGDARALLPQFHRRGGAGGHRLDPQVEAVIAAALDAAAKPSTGSLHASRVHDAVIGRINEINLVPGQQPLALPSVPTITRRFNDRFGAYEVCARNYGKKRADRLYREAGARIRAERALDVVQYDDTDTAVFLVDDRTGLPWGRAWLTSGIDEATGAIVGRALSERPRSTESALNAVINGIFPKDMSRPEFALCKGNWDWYGHHGIVVLDNASYNTCMSLESSVLEFGCEVQFARPHRPTDKTDIEHFHHRLKSEFIVNQPGWVGPKEDRELLDRGLGTAIMSLTDFERRLTAWIVDDYSNRPSGREGKSPREAWQENFTLMPPLLPARAPSQELMGTILDELTFRDSGGVKRMGLRYQSTPLQDLRKRLGRRATVSIRYSPACLEYVFVLDPFTKHYLRVPCIEDARYVAGLTNYQQHLILKKAAQMKLKSPGIAEMFAAREALAHDTEGLARSRKIKDRKLAYQANEAGFARTNDESAPGDLKQASPGGSVAAVSELEAMVHDLEHVPADESFMELE